MLDIRDLPWRDPATLFGAFAHDRHVAWLDSSEAGARGRWSYLAVEPFRVIEAIGDTVLLDGHPVDVDPFTAVERELRHWQLPPGLSPVPFATGAVGFLGYELGRHLERVPTSHPDDLAIPEMSVAFYDVVLAFDSLERRAYLLSSGFPAEGAARRARAGERADAILCRLDGAAPALPTAVPPLDWREETPRDVYEARIRRVLEHIDAGDIYQANFTVRHLAPRPPGLDPAGLYLALRAASPAPFAAYLACGPRLTLLSASPERFLALASDGTIEARPIKGTRPRGATPEEDARQREALLASEKDRAENLMIVDLLRNDIGRVAETGSVAVGRLFELESFSRVHHLVSSVTARLRPGVGAVGLLRATFPGGSVTGAPKIRAMEVIDALEAARRGPYCGAIAWLGCDGAMDASIVIRTVVATPAVLVAQAGGGIVADSDPAAEYAEMRVKLAPLLLGRSP